MRTGLAVLLLLAPLVHADEGLPPHAVARLGAPRFHNPDGVGAGAVSPDGRLVAFSSLEGGVCVWDAGTGGLVWKSDAPAARANVVAFDATGERLYGVCLGDVRVASWDAKTGAPLTGDALTEAPEIDGFAAAAAGHVALAADTGSVLLFDLATQRMLWCRTWLDREFECVAVSPDGSRVAVADGDGALLVLGPGGRELWRDAVGDLTRTALAFNADGTRLVAGNEDGGVQVFDAATGAVCASITGDEAWLLSIAFSPDGTRVVAASEDGFIQAWNSADGRKAWSVRFIPDPIYVLAFTPDGGTLVVASEIGAVRYIDPVTGRDRTPGDGHLDPVVALAFSPDGKGLVSGGVGGGVIIWDLEKASPRWRKAGGRYGVLSVAYDAGGAAVWVTDGAAVHRYGDGPGRHAWRRIEDHERLRMAMLTADGARVFALPYGTAGGTWDAATGKLLWGLPALTNEVTASATPSRGGLAVLAGGSEARVYVEGARTPPEVIPLNGDVQRVAVSADGRYLAASAGPTGIVVVYEVASGMPCVQEWSTTGPVTALCFGSDARTLAVGREEGEVELWDLPTRTVMSTLKGHSGRVTALAFSADGRRIASGGSDKTIYVWDVADASHGSPASVDIQGCWEGLSTPLDPYAAVWGLVDAGDEAVALIAGSLAPGRVDEGGIGRLLAQLDADEFEEREAASAALADLGTDAGPALEAALAASPSAEVRVRVERLLASMGGMRLTSPEALRGVRAIAVLEHIGTPAAHEALTRLASGAPQSRLTLEAKIALDRLGR